jgi:hypothetical protein
MPPLRDLCATQSPERLYLHERAALFRVPLSKKTSTEGSGIDFWHELDLISTIHKSSL